MQRADCVELGYISKVQGLNGEVRAILDVDDIRFYRKAKNLWLAKGPGPLKAWPLLRFTPQNDKEALIAFEGIETREAAEALKGHTLFFPKSELPALPEGRFYYFEIEGFTVEDVQHGALGPVLRVDEMPAQDLIVVDCKGKEVLIPLLDEFLAGLDKPGRILRVKLPPGLLEVYIGEEEQEEDDAAN